MHSLILTGRIVCGHDAADATAKTAIFFGLEKDAFAARVLRRVPVSVREVPDPNEAQAMRLRLMERGMDAEVVFSDGVKWQVEREGSARGPVPLAYLQGEYLAGRLGGEAQVKRVADSTWMPISSAVSGDTATRVSLQRPAGLSAALSEPSVSPPPPPIGNVQPPPNPAHPFPPSDAQAPPPPPKPVFSSPSPSQSISGAGSSIEASEAAKIFVAKNTEYYIKSWGLDGSPGRSWNWPAFFLGPVWMMYRKMYVYAAIWTALILAETTLEGIFDVSDRASRSLTIGLSIAVGCLGNWLYRRHFEHSFFSSSMNRGGSDGRLELARRGGVSVGAAVAYAIILVLLVVAAVVVAARIDATQ